MPARLKMDDQQVTELYRQGLSSRQIAKALGISKPTVLKRLREAGMERRPNRRRFFNEEAFSVFTPESCYWAGFLAADGWVDKRQTVVSVELAIKDRDHLVKLCGFLGADPAMVSERDKKQPWGTMGQFCAVHFCSMRMAKMLEENFNIVPNKSRTLRPPLLVPKELIHHFVRGYFDGDGWFSWSRGNLKCGFCSGSCEFLTWLRSSIHVLAHAKKPLLQQRPHSALYQIEFHGRIQVPEIVSWLYAGSTETSRLMRKYNDKTRQEATRLPTL
jgi:hypothetical protein